jgi:hypothetical protein
MKNNPSEPLCYRCVHRLEIPGEAHSRCNNHSALVEGDPHGIRMNWFLWPVNFDPVWLKECNGFSDKPEDRKLIIKLHPLLELIGFLKR